MLPRSWRMAWRTAVLVDMATGGCGRYESSLRMKEGMEQGLGNV